MKLLPALKLKVNSSKTQCMIVTNQRSRLPETITIDGIRIEIKDIVKVLGVTLGGPGNNPTKISRATGSQVDARIFDEETTYENGW